MAFAADAERGPTGRMPPLYSSRFFSGNAAPPMRARQRRMTQVSFPEFISKYILPWRSYWTSRAGRYTRCTPHSAGSGGHSSLSTVIGWIAIALTPSSPQCTVISYRHSSHRRGQQRIRLTRWLIKARHENDNNNTISTFLPYQQGRHLRGGGVWLLPIYL